MRSFVLSVVVVLWSNMLVLIFLGNQIISGALSKV